MCRQKTEDVDHLKHVLVRPTSQNNKRGAVAILLSPGAGQTNCIKEWPQ